MNGRERGRERGLSLIGVPGVIALEGGLPIEHDGHTIGGIGVSGVTAEQDGMIAAAGIAALRSGR